LVVFFESDFLGSDLSFRTFWIVPPWETGQDKQKGFDVEVEKWVRV